MLDILGIGPAEEKVYGLLVGHSAMTIGEVAEQCQMSRARSSRILHTLSDKGLANRLPGRLSKYVAVAPNFAIGALIRTQEERLGVAQLNTDKLMQAFMESKRQSHPAELIEIITGRANIVRNFHQIQRSATTEVRALCRVPYVEAVDARDDAETTMLGRSVSYRVIYDIATIELPGAFQEIQRNIAAGEQARVMTHLPIKLAVVDDRAGLMPLITGNGMVDSAILVHQSEVLIAFTALFDLLWEQASPIPGTQAGEPARGLSSQDAKLLVMLTAGMTDQAISRSLGCSLRTVQRQVRRLMDQLSAKTRFQIGVAAAQRGWIPTTGRQRTLDTRHTPDGSRSVSAG